MKPIWTFNRHPRTRDEQNGFTSIQIAGTIDILGLTATKRRILSLCDGQHTVDEIAACIAKEEARAIGKTEITDALFDLRGAGAIRWTSDALIDDKAQSPFVISEDHLQELSNTLLKALIRKKKSESDASPKNNSLERVVILPFEPVVDDFSPNSIRARIRSGGCRYFGIIKGGRFEVIVGTKERRMDSVVPSLIINEIVLETPLLNKAAFESVLALITEVARDCGLLKVRFYLESVSASCQPLKFLQDLLPMQGFIKEGTLRDEFGKQIDCEVWTKAVTAGGKI